jgi:nicotinic acid phosphoribosyltransferase
MWVDRDEVMPMSTFGPGNVWSSALLTDLYQLTMLQGYFEQGMQETAVFEFFVRKLPAQRNFLLAAGLEQALEFLENIVFTKTTSRNFALPGTSMRWRKEHRFSPTSLFSVSPRRLPKPSSWKAG